MILCNHCLLQIKVILLQYHEILFSCLFCHVKNNFQWCRHWDCLLPDLVDDFYELDQESLLTGVRYVVGSPVGVVAVSLVV
jgi:hypothetical protein